jgi:hypothetical protein
MTNPIQNKNAAFEAHESEVQTPDQIWEQKETEENNIVKEELDQLEHPEDYEPEPLPASLSQPERISKLLEE